MVGEAVVVGNASAVALSRLGGEAGAVGMWYVYGAFAASGVCAGASDDRGKWSFVGVVAGAEV